MIDEIIYFRRCDLCELDFISAKRMRQHYKAMHDTKAFKCKDSSCVDSFNTEKQMDAHYAKKHKRIECPHCQRPVKKAHLPRHIDEYHSGVVVVCELCGLNSPNQRQHSQHLKQAHDPRGSYQCDICKHW